MAKGQGLTKKEKAERFDEVQAERDVLSLALAHVARGDAFAFEETLTFTDGATYRVRLYAPTRAHGGIVVCFSHGGTADASTYVTADYFEAWYSRVQGARPYGGHESVYMTADMADRIRRVRDAAFEVAA